MIRRWLGMLLFAMLLALVLVVVVCLCALDRVFRFKLGFPRDLESLVVAEDWCVTQLQKAGALPEDLELESFSVVPFREQETLRSQMGLVSISYVPRVEEGLGEARSFRCLAKCAPVQGGIWGHTIYVLQGNCSKEVGFYKHLSGASSDVVPACYAAHASEGTGHFCLLLELLEEVKEYSEEEGCSPAAAERVMECLASLHGAFWGVDASSYKWLDVIPSVFVDLFITCFGRTLDRAYNGRSRDIWARCNVPQTVIHGDARVGNMLFPTDRGGAAIAFDWQATRLGLAVSDVAYFMVLSMETDVRLAHESSLLAHYHKALCGAGVEGYGLATLEEDYKHACLLLGQMFGLPFLSSEISADEEGEMENRERALSGGLVWSRRGYAFLKHLEPEWLREVYGIEKERLLLHTEESLLRPHRLNRGAWLVADYLNEHGGISALESLKSGGGRGEE